MNFLLRPFSLLLLLPLALTSLAQPPPSPAEPAAAPVAAEPATTPAAGADAAPADANKQDDRSGLRRIDQLEPATEAAASAQTEQRSRRRDSSGGPPFGDHTVPAGSRMGEVVSIMGSTTVAGEVGSDTVSIGGSTTILPGARVGGAAVAVLGRVETEGVVEGEVVSVLGGVRINGPVGGEAVAVLGNMELGPKAVINGDLVVVGGKVTRHPDAIVRGSEVGVPGFAMPNTDWLATWLKRCVFYARPLAFGHNLGWAWAVAFSFLALYLLLALLFSRGMVRCAETLETRPGFSILAAVLTVFLTPIAIVLLTVTVVGALLVPFIGAGLFFAGLFGKAVMLAWIGRRFTKFFGDGPLGHPAFAVLIGGLIVMLIYTVPVVGFLSYKLLSWLGLGVVVYTIALSMKREKPAAPRGSGPLVEPVAGTYVPAAYPRYAPGKTAAAPLSVIPPVTSGVVAPPMMSAGFSEAPGVAAVRPATPAAEAVSSSVSEATPPVLPEPPPFTPPAPAAFVPPPAATVPPVPPSPPMAVPVAAMPPPHAPAAIAWPRAGFFIRLGALALDGVLVGMIFAFLTGLLPRFLQFHNSPGGWLLALAVYGAIMWKHKGTTIGGIVCGLKVVRVDNRELDWATAIVRALGCFLSLAVAGLGFIWVAIDDEKQSWHDKIAGTVVVVVPRGVSLV